MFVQLTIGVKKQGKQSDQSLYNIISIITFFFISLYNPGQAGAQPEQIRPTPIVRYLKFRVFLFCPT